MIKDLIKFVIGVIMAWWIALMFMVFVSLALLGALHYIVIIIMVVFIFILNSFTFLLIRKGND